LSQEKKTNLKKKRKTKTKFIHSLETSQNDLILTAWQNKNQTRSSYLENHCNMKKKIPNLRDEKTGTKKELAKR